MKRKIALGPGAASLILIVVILSLCMLTMLMQISSRNDGSLATRGTEMITRVYGLFSESEYRMAKLDAFLSRCQKAIKDGDEADYLDLVEENLPEGFSFDRTKRIITWKDPLDKRILTCSVELLPLGELHRTKWVEHTFDEPSSKEASEEEVILND